MEIKARREGLAGLNISDEVRAAAADCAKRLEPFGKTITEATDFFLHHLGKEQSAHAGKLVEEYIQARRRSQLSAKHVDGVRLRLLRFAESFANRPIKTIAAREIESWLYDLRGPGDRKLEPQTIVNWRAVINAFFSWLLRQKVIDFNPCAGVSKPRVLRAPPAIWAPEEMVTLLHAASADLVS